MCTSIGASAFYYCSSLTTADFPACKSISMYAFYYCSNLTSINFPVCTSIGASAFHTCYGLTSIDFPMCASIGNSAFYYCSNLTSINFPACTSIGGYAFAYCSSLTTATFPQCKSIYGYAFASCYKLSSLTLANSTVCALSASTAFNSTPFKGYSSHFSGTPHIYVPASLVDAYKSATNWTYFSSYITAISETNLITFTIDETEYQAEEGMTWAEWVESQYNIDGYYADNGSPSVIKEGYIYCVVNSEDYTVPMDEIIIQDINYMLSLVEFDL